MLLLVDEERDDGEATDDHLVIQSETLMRERSQNNEEIIFEKSTSEIGRQVVICILKKSIKNRLK